MTISSQLQLMVIKSVTSSNIFPFWWRLIVYNVGLWKDKKSTILVSIFISTSWYSVHFWNKDSSANENATPSLAFWLSLFLDNNTFPVWTQEMLNKMYPFLWANRWENQLKCKPHARKNLHCRRLIFWFFF